MSLKLGKSPWVTVEKPGWYGEAKNSRLEEYDQKYGAGNWRIRHRLGQRLLDFTEATRLYELCYELHFLSPYTRYLWNFLFEQASEVWTELETDVQSGTDYSIQLAPAPHYEDIAIRLIMKRYGKEFKGEKLMRIRADSPDPIGVALSSVHIPFVFSDLIEEWPKVEWWNRHKGSLEHAWHANKEFQIKRELAEQLQK